MIFRGILDFTNFMGSIFLSLFIDADPEVVESITNFSSGFKAYLIQANWFFPVDVSLLLLSIMVAIEIGLLGFRLARILANWS